jgi:hypothetical protein
MACFISYVQKTTALFFFTLRFEGPEDDKVTMGGKSVVFRRCGFCFVACIAVIHCLLKGVAGP